jgi:hypothetical protein
MRRRSFIAVLGLTATSLVSFNALGQSQAKRHRIGLIHKHARDVARSLAGTKALSSRDEST